MITTLTAIFLTASACAHPRASVECPIVGYVVATEAQRAGVGPALALAVGLLESRLRSGARNECCVGPMQVHAGYHCGGGACDTWADQTRAGVGVLARYVRDAESVREALRHYNCGRRRAEYFPECGAGYAATVLRIWEGLRHD